MNTRRIHYELYLEEVENPKRFIFKKNLQTTNFAHVWTINTPTILQKRIALRCNLETSLNKKTHIKRIQMRLYYFENIGFEEGLESWGVGGAA